MWGMSYLNEKVGTNQCSEVHYQVKDHVIKEDYADLRNCLFNMYNLCCKVGEFRAKGADNFFDLGKI